MTLRSVLQKLKSVCSRAPVLRICAALLSLHWLYYTFAVWNEQTMILPYEFGMGLLSDLALRLPVTVFRLARVLLLAGVLFALFLFLKKALDHAKKTDGADAAALLGCLFCAFPFFLTGRVFQYSYSFLLHLTVSLLTMFSFLRLSAGKRKVWLLPLCAVCEFLYADYLFTCFPAILLLFTYEKANDAERRRALPAKTTAQKSKRSAVQAEPAKPKARMLPLILFAIVAAVGVLLFVFTPALNERLRKLPAFETPDQSVLYDSIDELRSGEWNAALLGLCLNYIAAALPFLAFFASVWLAAARKAGKEHPAFAQFFCLCLCAEVPALAGILFFRKIGLWTVSVLLGQVCLLLHLMEQNDPAVIAVLRAADRLRQKKLLVFILLLFAFAFAAGFYELAIFNMVRSNAVW